MNLLEVAFFVIFKLDSHQESGPCDVWVHPAIDGGEAEPVEGGAERPFPGGACLKNKKMISQSVSRI